MIHQTRRLEVSAEQQKLPAAVGTAAICLHHTGPSCGHLEQEKELRRTIGTNHRRPLQLTIIESNMA